MVLAGDALGEPKSADGVAQVVRVLRRSHQRGARPGQGLQRSARPPGDGSSSTS
jgi:hypothetical protein